MYLPLFVIDNKCYLVSSSLIAISSSYVLTKVSLLVLLLTGLVGSIDFIFSNSWSLVTSAYGSTLLVSSLAVVLSWSIIVFFSSSSDLFCFSGFGIDVSDGF